MIQAWDGPVLASSIENGGCTNVSLMWHVAKRGKSQGCIEDRRTRGHHCIHGTPISSCILQRDAPLLVSCSGFGLPMRAQLLRLFVTHLYCATKRRGGQACGVDENPKRAT